MLNTIVSFSEALQQGTANAWLFVPSAILLGALHGLEPGHSKTMMAAFIIAVRGKVTQAILLGLSATLSHTAVVWIVALVGLQYGSRLNMETAEPYFQIASAVLMIGLALWMLWRTHRDCLHERQHEAHGHIHAYEGAHEKVHAQDIQRRFSSHSATTRQIIIFGLTSGLGPCPAAITVLLLCLQLKQVTLGIALVLCFSIGLALTMVMSGVMAALGTRHLGKRWSGVGQWARRAPYLSSMLIVCIALYIGYQGWMRLSL
jgi:nickel/cobalt exporter